MLDITLYIRSMHMAGSQKFRKSEISLDTGSGFSQNFDSESARKTQNPAGVDPALQSNILCIFSFCLFSFLCISHFFRHKKALHSFFLFCLVFLLLYLIN